MCFENFKGIFLLEPIGKLKPMNILMTEFI